MPIEGRGRRSFLTSLAGVFVSPAVLGASQPLAEPWLDGMNGAHRQFFDVGMIADVKPLARIDNFLTAYTSAYQLREQQINVLFGAHGQGLAFVCGDATWAKYALGDFYGVQDAKTNKPATRNVFAVPLPNGDARLRPGASVSELMKRGVRFLACQNSINTLSKQLSAKGHGAESEIRDEIRRGLVSGVMPVPAMLVAGNRAQEVGFTYAFIS